jgi:hypothetical protein
MRVRCSLGIAVSLIGVLASLAGCGEEQRDRSTPLNEGLNEVTERLQFFRTQHPTLEIIKWAEEDLNADGRKDLVVMYRVDPDQNRMRVILDLGGEYLETNEVPAPYSDQVVQFRDIDRKPPMEFIVQGVRGVKMGFAVFRIEENRLVDLFGEGMRDCC